MKPHPVALWYSSSPKILEFPCNIKLHVHVFVGAAVARKMLEHLFYFTAHEITALTVSGEMY